MPAEHSRLHGTAFLLQKNLLLTEVLIAAPAAAFADSLQNALAVCFVFCCVTGLTVLLAAFLPRRMPFAFRILSYSLLAALVYIPTALAADFLFDGVIARGGIYLPLLSCGILLTAEHDRLFHAERLTILLGRLICALAGVCLTVLLIGFMRELLGAGTLYGHPILPFTPLPAMGTPACGLLLLGCLCVLTQVICRGKEDADASDH